MNAIDLILKDHAKIRKLFNKVIRLIDSDELRKNSPEYLELRDFLIQHETMEETLFYPHFETQAEFKSIVSHLISEEKKASKALKEIDNAEDKDERNVKLKKLHIDVEHHANEEEAKLFPKLQKHLSAELLVSIGSKISPYKKKARNMKK